jgi:hypothetical protein
MALTWEEAMANRRQQRRTASSRHRDPVSGEPGTHLVGVGVGAAVAGAAGAAVGSFAGPVAAVIGAAVGGVVGGLAGKEAAEGVNPSAEDSYWREQYSSRTYAEIGRTYEDYQPAYRHGWEGVGRYGELNWAEAEPHLRSDWEQSSHASSLDWDEASPAVRDAWERIRPGADYSDENR